MGDTVRMIIAGLVFAAVAAVLHCFIFYLESIAWTSARARAAFGTTRETAEITKPLAFNQGFYNLFLAIAVFICIATFAPCRTVGATLVFTGAGTMLAASLVLVTSDRTKARAAMIQGAAPLLAVALLAVGVAA